MSLALGRVIGCLLDRHASGEPGQARLLREQADGIVECQLYWLNVNVWRLEYADGWTACDGTTVGSGHDDLLLETAPCRPGWPPYDLQLVFPLRGHFWGRMGDDYYMSAVRPVGSLTFVGVEGTEDDRQGHLLVDEDGFIVQFARPHGTVSLVEHSPGRLPASPDRLFALPRKN